MSKAGLASLAYFYFDFKDTAKQDVRAFLSSLVIQLSAQSYIFCDILTQLYFTHRCGSTQPSGDSLAQCLKSMLTAGGQAPIYLILDAVDECPNDSGMPSPREKVLDLLEELAELRLPNLRLCVTSRPETDIRTTLGPLASHELLLEDQSGQKQDIIYYINSVVRSDRKMRRWREEDRKAVVEKLSERADGM